MSQNNSTNSSLEQMSGIKQGSEEFGSMRSLHQQYNQLSGFESMLHIIKKYRYVLYPFIFLSILGSTYSFYNDFIVGFPMNSKTINFLMAFGLSVALEIVRDASILALFNSKMHLPSRLLVSMIFLVVTAYLFSSHMNAIKIIEKSSIAYTLANQTTETQTITNPKIGMIQENLNRALGDLNSTKKEYSKQLDISANAKYKVNKINAQNQLPILKKDKEKYEAQVKEYQNELISLKEDNIKSVEDSQKIISAVLLATLILVESLAMLGAVIKFIVTNNADKEIAKHSEIIEEYISISEVMKTTNISLTQNMAAIAQQNADNNLKTIELMANMNNQINSKIYQFMDLMSKQNFNNVETPQPQKKQVTNEQRSQKDFIINLFKNVKKAGDKLESKSNLINVDNRAEDRFYKEIMSELTRLNVVEYKKGHGYYALTTLEGVISAIS